MLYVNPNFGRYVEGKDGVPLDAAESDLLLERLYLPVFSIPLSSVSSLCTYFFVVPWALCSVLLSSCTFLSINGLGYRPGADIRRRSMWSINVSLLTTRAIWHFGTIAPACTGPLWISVHTTVSCAA